MQPDFFLSACLEFVHGSGSARPDVSFRLITRVSEFDDGNRRIFYQTDIKPALNFVI